MLRTLIAVPLRLALGFALGAQAQTIKIAILGPMAFVQGEHHWNGAEMARDEINKAGGINVGGKRMQHRAGARRHQRDPVGARRHQRGRARDYARQGRLPDRRLPLRGGARDAGSGDGLQEALPRRRRRRIPSSVATSSRTTSATSTGSASRRPKDVDLARTLFAVLGSIGQQIRNDLKTDTPKVAILAEKAVWTEGLVAAAQKNLPALKMEVVGTWQPSAVATDVTAELSAIDRAGAHIVFTMLSGPVGISVGRQMGERNMKAVAWGINVEGQKEEFWRPRRARPSSSPPSIPMPRWSRRRRPWRSCGLQGALQEGADLHRGDLRRDHDAEGRDRDRKAPPMPTSSSPIIEKIEHVGTGADRNFDKRHDLVWAVGKTVGHRGAVAGRQEGSVLAAQRERHAALQDAGALAPLVPGHSCNRPGQRGRLRPAGDRLLADLRRCAHRQHRAHRVLHAGGVLLLHAAGEDRTRLHSFRPDLGQRRDAALRCLLPPGDRAGATSTRRRC